MKSLAEYLELSSKAHGHLCAGQVLGVRLAMLGLRELGIDDPVADHKRLVTYVEIDRCVTDAVAVVAHCRLGKRALKFRDWGKVAATFVDLQTGRAIRIAAKESSKQAAREMFPELAKEAGQQKAYAQLPDEVLFDKHWVKVGVPPEDLPGFKGARVACGPRSFSVSTLSMRRTAGAMSARKMHKSNRPATPSSVPMTVRYSSRVQN